MPALKILSFIFILSFHYSINAQINVDSLYILLSKSKGIERIDLLNTLAWEVKYSDPEKALEFCKNSIDLAKAENYTQGEAQAYYHSAILSYFRGETTTSLELGEKSVALFESINNSLGLAKNLNLRGMNLSRLKNYAEAIENYDKAITICELFEYDDLKTKVLLNKANILYGKGDFKGALDEFSKLSSSLLAKGDSTTYHTVLHNMALTQRKLGKHAEALSNFFKMETYYKAANRPLYLANIYNDIGILYLRLGLQEPTLEMFDKAIRLYEELDNYRKLVLVNMNLGIYFSDNEQYEESEFYYEKALHINDSLGLTNTGAIFNNLAELNIKTGKYKQALALLDESLKINLANESKTIIAKNYVNMAAAHFELGKLQKSEENFLKAFQLNQEIGDINEQQKASEGLSTIYKLNKNNRAYERYSSIAKTANDSLFNRKKLLEVNKLLITKQHEEYKKKAAALNQKLTDTEAQLATAEKYSSRYKTPFLFLLVLLSIGVFWLFTRLRHSSEINRTLKSEAEEHLKRHETIIENQNKQLTLLSLETAQQTDLYKKIHDSLQKIIAEHPENLELKKLKSLLNTQTIEQNNWQNFIIYFNKVYVGFFDRVAQNYPSITNKELRLCALIRLKIPIYEMSIILGVSPRSVHKSRYRIRKKMALNSEENLDEFICSI